MHSRDYWMRVSFFEKFSHLPGPGWGGATIISFYLVLIMGIVSFIGAILLLVRQTFISKTKLAILVMAIGIIAIICCALSYGLTNPYLTEFYSFGFLSNVLFFVPILSLELEAILITLGGLLALLGKDAA
jgi:nitrate reductase gamma subunit